jgi:hypothetical protein
VDAVDVENDRRYAQLTEDFRATMVEDAGIVPEIRRQCLTYDMRPASVTSYGKTFAFALEVKIASEKTPL